VEWLNIEASEGQYFKAQGMEDTQQPHGSHPAHAWGVSATKL